MKVEISDYTHLIDSKEIVPGSLHTLLVLVDKDQEKRELTLADFDVMNDQTLVAEVNLNVVEKNKHPLKPGEYIMFIKVEWQTIGRNKVSKVLVPLGGDVKKYLK